MYIEDIFYSTIGTVRDIVGSGIAAAGIVWLAVKGFSAVCLAFGITAE